MALSPPSPLASHHDLSEFQSGEPRLDDWLRKRAPSNQVSGGSRTFVLCDDERVIGFYALAAGSVTGSEVPGSFRRNQPEPIPVVVLGRLAVDLSWQGKGAGRSLMIDATRRVLAAAHIIGVRGMIVSALNENARSFYLGFGFIPCPNDPSLLVITTQALQNRLVH